MADERLVACEHFAQDDRDAPPVEENVMERPKESRFLFGQAEQREEDERPFRQIEGASLLVALPRQDAAGLLVGIERGPVFDRPHGTWGAADDLNRLGDTLPDED